MNRSSEEVGNLPPVKSISFIVVWHSLGYGTFKSFSGIFNMQPRLRLADLKQWVPNFDMHQRFVKAQVS